MRKIVMMIAVVAIGGAILVQKSVKTDVSEAFDLPEMSFVQKALSNISMGGVETKVPVAVHPEAWAETLGTVNDLHYKVIRSSEDKKFMETTLSSRTNMDYAGQEILHLDGSALAANQKRRMDAVLFLMRALDLKQNPEREYLENKIAELILSEDIDTLSDLALKKSAAADRMELFVTLSEKSPDAAARVRSQAKTEFQKRILQFATNFYDLNKKEN